MPKTKNSYDVTSVKTTEEFQRFVAAYLSELGSIINGRLEFGPNIWCDIVQHTFSGTGEDAISHNLGRVPTGYIVARRSTGTIVYDGTSEWTKDTIYLDCGGSIDTTLVIF